MIEKNLPEPDVPDRGGRRVIRIGIPTHFVPEVAFTSACGIVRPRLSASMAAEIDCLSCRKTKLFKQYA